MYNDDDFKDEEESESNQSENKLLDFYYANKKLIWILGGIIIFILIASLFMDGGDNNKPVTPIEPDLVISSYNEKISIDSSVQLFASVEGDENAIFNWSSSNPNVATVGNAANNNAVVVTGISYGTSIITVTYTKDGKAYSEKCEIVVAEGNPNISITQVSFPKGELMISVGDTFKLPVIVTPSDGYKKSVSFVSYNKDIVSVDEDGMIKALKAGKATVKVTVNNEFTSEINIHVLDKKVAAQIVVNPTKLDFLDNLLKIEVGESVELEYDFEPIDITLSSLVWKSSDETVAKVVNGIVTGYKVGKAEITLTSLNGITIIMTVEVVPDTIPVESVQILSETNITLNVGGVSNIVANVTPADATNKSLTYHSSNNNIVTVDSNGNIKAVSKGTATITVSSVDGNKTATINVLVNANSSSSGSSGSSGGSSSGSSSSSSGSSSGSTSNQEKEACYLIAGEYKWTTRSQALKEDSNAIISSSYNTKEKCENQNLPVTTNSFNINKEIKAFNTKETGYVTRLRLIVNSKVTVYYCYDKCTINPSNAYPVTGSTGRDTFGNGIGNKTYYKSTTPGRTYYFEIDSTSEKYFYVSGTNATNVNFKVKFSNGSYSDLATVSLTAPNS